MAMEFESRDEVDLFFVCDTTASMGAYISSLSSTIRQIFAVIKLLFRGRVKLHVVSYKDYCDGKLIVTHCSQRTHSNKEILNFVNQLVPHGGGDIPEAIKTAFNYVYEMIHDISKKYTRKNIIFIFTDAPPHHPTTSSRYYHNEINEIKKKYLAGYDWIQIKNKFQKNNILVYTFHSSLDCPYRTAQSIFFYSFFGPVVLIENTSTNEITKATIGLLLQLMGQKFIFSNDFTCVRVWEQEILDTFVSETTFPTLELLPHCTKQPFQFPLVPYMLEDLSVLPQLFQTDQNYQTMVYNVFGAIFTPSNVLALTYNPILAKLWRLCCSQRTDPRYKLLSRMLSICVPALHGAERKQLQEWIEESHIESETIRNDIIAITSKTPCLILERSDVIVLIDPVDLRSLARAPYPGVIKNVQKILTHLKIVTDINQDVYHDEGIPMYLPLELPDRKLFSYISHLVHTGTSFSLRGSAMIAMICTLSKHGLLEKRASAFLYSIRGKWIPLSHAVDYPEILSLEFIKLMYRGQEFLTSEEQMVYQELYKLHRMRTAANKQVDVIVGATPTKANLIWDNKVMCRGCGFLTSTTLMHSIERCGLCVFHGSDRARSLQRRQVTPSTKSNMVECSSCSGLYAVIQPKLLNIAPKCHFCRMWTKPRPVAPKIECARCLNQYLDPAGFITKEYEIHGTWICAPCNNTVNGFISSRSVPFHEFLIQNPSIVKYFGWKKPKKCVQYVNVLMNRSLNYFKIYTGDHQFIFKPRAIERESCSTDSLQMFGKKVHQVDTFCTNLAKDIMENSLTDYCNLCFEECALPRLESACGRCITRICDGCARQWYSNLNPGKIIYSTYLKCPFCRQDPLLSWWKRYNKSALHLVSHEKSNYTFNEKFYYGWCSSCYKIDIMMEKSCTRDPPINKKDFQCESCISHQDLTIYPRCPCCNIPIEKYAGCDHISCLCGQNWCYHCHQSFSCAQDCYHHVFESKCYKISNLN